MLKIIEKLEPIVRENEPNELYTLCLVTKIETTEEPHIQTLHSSEIELIEFLTLIQNATNFYAPTMNEIWAKVQAYAKFKYFQGISDANL